MFLPEWQCQWSGCEWDEDWDVWRCSSGWRWWCHNTLPRWAAIWRLSQWRPGTRSSRTLHHMLTFSVDFSVNKEGLLDYSQKLEALNLVVSRRSIGKMRFLSSSGPGPGQVQVRSRSKSSEIDLSHTLFLVFTTHHPPPTRNFFFLALKGSRQVRWT